MNGKSLQGINQGRFDKKHSFFGVQYPICLEGDIYNYEKEFLEEVSYLAVQCDASKPASLNDVTWFCFSSYSLSQTIEIVSSLCVPEN